jgi:MFS transporter, BCD family, chlorophyll transporter
VVTMALNIVALWKQEARNPALTSPQRTHPTFAECWQSFRKGGRSGRILVAVGLGSAGFSMQDILLEPYGGEVLKLGVGATTTLTAMLAAGTLAAFALAARAFRVGVDPYRLAGYGALAGVIAFACVIFAAPFDSAVLFRAGTTLIGFGGGLFAVGMLSGAMALAEDGYSGMALGAWGAVQASATGLAMAAGGAIRDVSSNLAAQGLLGPALTGPSVGYAVVYHLEILLLFVTIAAVGPLVRPSSHTRLRPQSSFGLAEFPG